MVDALLICCAILGDDVKPVVTTANDRVADVPPQRRRAKRRRLTCARPLVRGHGMTAERDKHLNRAVALDPTNVVPGGCWAWLRSRGNGPGRTRSSATSTTTPSFRQSSANTSIAACDAPEGGRAVAVGRLVPGERSQGRGDGPLSRSDADRSFPRRRLDQAGLQEEQGSLGQARGSGRP